MVRLPMDRPGCRVVARGLVRTASQTQLFFHRYSRRYFDSSFSFPRLFLPSLRTRTPFFSTVTRLLLLLCSRTFFASNAPPVFSESFGLNPTSFRLRRLVTPLPCSHSVLLLLPFFRNASFPIPPEYTFVYVGS